MKQPVSSIRPRQTHPKLFDPAKDGYLRFPLAALAYGDDAGASLSAIIYCGVVNAGIGLRQTSLSHYHGLLAASDIWEEEFLKLDPDGPEVQQLSDVCAGLKLMSLTSNDWRRVRDNHARLTQPQQTSQWWSEPPQNQALVTMKASWVLHALFTERHRRHSAHLPEDWDPTRQWLSWREFRVLCAVLSVIGKKPFAWISTATLAHRVLGFTSAKFHRLHLAKNAARVREARRQKESLHESLHGRLASPDNHASDTLSVRIASPDGIVSASQKGRIASSQGIVSDTLSERIASPNGIANALQKGRSASPEGIAQEAQSQSQQRDGSGSKASMIDELENAHLAPLSRWQIESTLADLEKNRFFLRFRASSATSGRGGRTAYSIRHKTRAKLARDIQTQITTRRTRGPATLSENRGKDQVLWKSGQETPTGPLDEAPEEVSEMASPKWLTLPPA
jgi:hypothetical protein